jgi:hypothetical protein
VPKWAYCDVMSRPMSHDFDYVPLFTPEPERHLLAVCPSAGVVLQCHNDSVKFSNVGLWYF